jgi:hypothetical protein
MKTEQWLDLPEKLLADGSEGGNSSTAVIPTLVRCFGDGRVDVATSKHLSENARLKPNLDQCI